MSGASEGRVRRRRRAIVVSIAVVAAILLGGRAVSAVYVDYQWYAEMHAVEVWRTRLANLALLTGITAAAIMLFVFANLYAVRRSIVAVVLPRRMGNLEIGEEVPGRYLTAIAGVSSVVLGIVLALPPEPWTELAAARYGLPFGDTDPYFQADLGFFVYWLPLESALYVRALLVLLVTVCVVLVLYFAVTPSLRWDRTRFHVTAHVRRHAAALTPCFFAVVAWMYRLDAFNVLCHGSGPHGAFTYIDHHFTIPADRGLELVTLAAGCVAGFTLWRGQLRTTLAVVTASLVLPFIVFEFVPPILRSYAEAQHAAPREQPYGVIRSQATRAAYALARLRLTVPESADAPLRFVSPGDAVPAVSIWDPMALTRALEGGGIRGHVSDAVAWRMSATGLLALAVERSDPLSLDGAVLGGSVIPVRATAADDRGGPERSDVEGRLGGQEVPIAPVLVYEGATEPIIVADSENRIAAPRIDGFGARLAHAWSAQRLGLLGIDLPGPRPKLVTRRDLRERLRALVPFFAQGSNVWPVLDGDSLFWAVDLYSSVTDTYPLSQHFTLAHEDRSYFQHAATAFVEAYSGRVVVAADSVRDPIAETWVRRFPGLFATWAQLPRPLVAYAPPATDAAFAMADAFGAVGTRTSNARPGAMAAPHAPATDNADTVLASGEPPCIAADNACAWSIPMIDAADHVTGIVVGTGGARRVVSWVPLTSSGPRWPAALERLQHAAESSSARREPALARGRVRAVLLGNRLALIQPRYAWRPDGPPTVLDITALVGDSAAAGATLAEALGVADTSQGGRQATPAPTDFRSRVGALYDAMQAALRRGDMAAFGAAYAELGHLLRQSNAARPAVPRPAR